MWLPSPGWRTRFAPSPTGYLHLGHALHAVCVWGVARAFGGTVVLRIEDHDRVRCKPEYERALLDDLEWLGLEPDEGLAAMGEVGPAFRQSSCAARYERAALQLSTQGLLFACTCSRREIAAVAGDVAGTETPYPGTCRARHETDDATAQRVMLPHETVQFIDARLGAQTQVPAEQCGDVLIRDRRGQWTYQFAVVVDDLAHNIDVVIRGEDLLASTGRQILLRRLLSQPGDLPPTPQFLHHPVLLREDGAKLSKASQDTGLRELREAGVDPRSLLADAVRHLGMHDVRASTLRPGDLGDVFANHGAWFPFVRTPHQ